LEIKAQLKDVQILQRELTPQETEQVNAGFDALSLEEGVALESREPINLLAMKENELIGCATGSAHKNGEEYTGWFHLTDLYVEKEYRDQGMGSELLNELEETLRQMGIRHIWLWTSAEPTLRFYRRHGYTQFTEMENWYSDGSSRIGMRKTIT